MSEVGIRELKQNASAIVARAVGGEKMTITDRGRPVAVLTGITRSPLEELVEHGVVRTKEEGVPIWEMDIEPVDLGAATSTDWVLDQLREERV